MKNINKVTPPEILSYRNQRRSVGVLGIILPVMLIGFSAFYNCKILQSSISQYYYTSAGVLLVGVLSAVGLFLISYKGPAKIDDYATNFAGICAIGIAYLPTGTDLNGGCVLFCYEDNKIINVAHYLFAAFFFAGLAANSYFLFTRSDSRSITTEKNERNKIYRICGILMIIFAALIPLSALPLARRILGEYNPTFLLECGALLSFGISWLVKGETFLKDSDSSKMVEARASDVFLK